MLSIIIILIVIAIDQLSKIACANALKLVYCYYYKYYNYAQHRSTPTSFIGAYSIMPWRGIQLSIYQFAILLIRSGSRSLSKPLTEAWYSMLERRKYSVMNGRSSTKLICSASAASAAGCFVARGIE